MLNFSGRVLYANDHVITIGYVLSLNENLLMTLDMIAPKDREGLKIRVFRRLSYDPRGQELEV